MSASAETPPPDGDPVQEFAPNLRLLKSAVIIMAVLLVIGFLALVFGIIWKATKVATPKSGARAAASPATGEGFGAVDIPLPEGASLVSATSAEGRLILHLAGGEGGETLILIDPATGHELGRLRLTPRP